MGRLIVFLLGLAVLAYAAFLYIDGRAGKSDGSGVVGPSAAKQTLDRMRETKEQIDDDARQRADDLFERTK